MRFDLFAQVGIVPRAAEEVQETAEERVHDASSF
jgi:hypothetical protein